MNNILQAALQSSRQNVQMLCESAALADHVILAPGEQTNLIQECHLIIEHILCYLIEKNLVDAGLVRYIK